ncbi:MAG: hypothetical protein ACLRSW_15580 [Christensenellaceae bacterium]
MEKYRTSFEEIKKHRALFFEALILNIAQRVSQILITCFVCLAADRQAPLADVFVMQAFVLIGYNSVPLPGGVARLSISICTFTACTTKTRLFYPP